MDPPGVGGTRRQFTLGATRRRRPATTARILATMKWRTMVGAHLAPEDPLGEAEAVGADCVQVFLSDPQGWRKPPPREDAAELRASPMPLYVHAPYLINVCSPLNNVRYGSRKILRQTCEAAAEVGAAAVIVHPGHAEDEIAEGIGRWVRTLEMLESEVPLYIENTAGGEKAVARRFDHLARLWEGIASADHGIDLGFCFDTCHAHAAGEEIDAERLRAMIKSCGGPVVIETPGSATDLRSDIEFVREALPASRRRKSSR